MQMRLIVVIMSFPQTHTTTSSASLANNVIVNSITWLAYGLGLLIILPVCNAGPHEKRLLHALLDNYNSLERPVVNESDPLQLSFGLTLMQIIDVDEKNQLLITNIWLKLEWNDMNLRWNSSEFGGVRDLRIPPHRLWKPDVLMYNSADEGFDGTYATNVVVRNNGSCLYVPPGIFKSTCKIDITWFPFDDQRCEMKFGSWTYDGFQELTAGFLVAGAGCKKKDFANYFTVEATTPLEDIEDYFEKAYRHYSIGIICIDYTTAKRIHAKLDQCKKPLPIVVVIPTKDTIVTYMLEKARLKRIRARENSEH